MKKRKIVVLLFLLSILFTPFLIKAEESDENISKGALRCPLNLDSKTSCNEIKDSNGNVIQVDLIYIDDEIEIVKTVKKTETLGTYDVSFNVKGDSSIQQAVPGDVYIVIVLDMSSTIKNNISDMREAVQEFSETVLEQIPEAKIALVQFATRAVVSRSFDNTPITSICSYNSNCNGTKLKTTSQVGYGLAQATNLLNSSSIPSSANKYIVLFGDGRYWYPDDTYWASWQAGDWDRNEDIKYSGNNYVAYQKNFIDENNIFIYGIRYLAGSRNSGFNNKYNKVGGTFNNYGAADDAHMRWLVNDNYYSASSADEFKTKFLEVASQITSDPSITETTVSSDLVDNIGPAFSLTNSYSKYVKYSLESFNRNGTTFGPFSIEIDPYSETGWHETNASFNLSYTTSEGEEKTITCNENPEVYWIQQKLEIKSCSGVATSDTIKMGDSDEYEYYEKVCYEGYLRDNKYYNGFSVGIKINNLPDGTIAFGIEGGLGFPANINISTNLMCQYKFDYEKFNEDYSEIVSNLNSTSDPKEIASLTKRRNSLDKILDNYVNLTKNDLENYIARFTDQSATIRVDYNDLESSDVLTFTDSSETNSNLSCQNVRNQTINGKSVIVNQTCYLSLSKSMHLPNSCLDMTTGEQINCSSSNTQISGGSNFYVNLKATGGKIYVNLENAGYSGLLNVKLEDCSYTASQMNITYRSIDLADPFNQNYGTNREIGKNYFNNKYNFVNIIKSDIWEQNYTYQYSLSKENVENIRHDTSEEGVSSYNGRNCYFNSSNKYVCEFTRSGLEGETTNLFSKVEIND